MRQVISDDERDARNDAADAKAREDACRAEARATYLQTAIETVFYLACGRVLRAELAAKHGLPPDIVQGLMCVAATQLVDEISAEVK